MYSSWLMDVYPGFLYIKQALPRLLPHGGQCYLFIALAVTLSCYIFAISHVSWNSNFITFYILWLLENFECICILHHTCPLELLQLLKCQLSMWGKIIIPMYRLWLHGLYGLYGPRCPLSPKRPINLISLYWNATQKQIYNKAIKAIALPIFQYIHVQYYQIERYVIVDTPDFIFVHMNHFISI